MAPLLLFGHACELLVARLDTDQAGVVRLQITADYGDNPMLVDEAAAEKAVKSVLQVKTAKGMQSLQQLAPLHVQKGFEWDPLTPAAFAPPADGQVHQLLTASWEWQPDVPEISFGVPDGSIHDVLLWTTAPHLPGKQVQWMLLIEGEQSPSIALPADRSGHRWWIIGPSVAAAALGFAFTRRFRGPLPRP